MILFIGQVGGDVVEREGFQEIDYRRMFGEMAKWVAQIDDPARVPEYISRAYHTALSGRPGPVVLALPEDMLSARTAAPDLPGYRVVGAAPDPTAMAELRERLTASERPFMIVGGGGWTPEACADIQAFAEAAGVPVGAAFRRQDIVDNDSPVYVGDVGIGINPALAARLRGSDLILAVGPRLGEITTNSYTLPAAPKPPQTLVHVFPGAEELGRVYRADLPIQTSLPAFAASCRALAPVDGSAWAAWTAAARADYEAWQVPPDAPGALDLGAVVTHLRQVLPADAIVTNGAGNYTSWWHRFHRFRRPRSQLAPTSGAMGYGLPAALAAKAACPDRTVVCVAGDGCFLMTGQELATAVQEDLPILILVVNNGLYGTIRMHQERHYPARVHGTTLRNPDFAALAQAYGAFGTIIDRTADFPPALDAALASGRPALIELRIDPEAITPRETLSGIRNTALQHPTA